MWAQTHVGTHTEARTQTLKIIHSLAALCRKIVSFATNEVSLFLSRRFNLFSAFSFRRLIMHIYVCHSVYMFSIVYFKYKCIFSYFFMFTLLFVFLPSILGFWRFIKFIWQHNFSFLFSYCIFFNIIFFIFYAFDSDIS